jgi:predicted DNA-binding ribbon-helix-helix protein
MRLEPELWDALREICARERRDLNCLVREIEAAGPTRGRTSAVRVFVVQYLRAAASENGQAACYGQLSDVSPIGELAQEAA